MRLMVLDGNSIVNRAFYGVRMLTTRDGQPTNAVYGFLNILTKLMKELEPDALCVAFDRKEPTFRHEAFDHYKSQRKEMPEELAAQLPVLKKVLDAINIPRYELAGWEADDLIGTISHRCEAEGWDCIVVTGDKDSLQLITERTFVELVVTRMGTTTTREMTPEVFREDYGFDPPRIVDLKALMGDASDNIPGVKGVGQKTAMALIQTYGSLEKVYEDLDKLEVKPSVRKKLEEGAESARMSYDLATIHRDAPMEFHPEDALRRPINRSELYNLFLQLEFSSFIDRLGLRSGQGDAPASDEDGLAEHAAETVLEDSRLAELLETWKTAEWVGVLALPDLSGVAVEWKGRAAVLLADRLPGYSEALHVLFGGEIRKVGYQIKDLMRTLLEEELPAEGFCFDIALAAYLLAPTDGSYELEKLGMTYFHREFPKKTAYLSAGAFSQLNDSQPAIEAFSAHCTLIGALYRTLAPRLQELGMQTLYETVELPLCIVLAEMERTGFLVDRGALAAFGKVLTGRIEQVQKEIYQLAGVNFNINSTQQLGYVLFDTLELPPVKKTKTGYSTNAEVLEKLRGFHPIIEQILEYRQLTKLNSTYVEGLTKVIAPDGRIHTCFQNTVTATGRLSSTEPNLQNIPVRTELGARLREMFVASEGSVLVDADYSQIELRLLAQISGDPNMIAAFRRGEDIHRSTAAQVFGVTQEEVTPEMRRRAKAVNFGIIYGISEFSLSQDIGVTRKEAGAYMQKYFRTYPGIRAYMDHVVEQAKIDGYVSTLMGRRRWLPELKSTNFNLRSFGERVALNMPIQGTAADLMKLAMIRVRDRMRREDLRARLVLQIHDELIVECPEAEADRVKKLLTEEMEGVAQYEVPLVAAAAVGKSWAEAK